MFLRHNADSTDMSSISSLAGNLLQTILPSSLFSNNAIAANSSSSSSLLAQSPDSGQVSAFGQLAGALQQLQQSNPAQYKQVTQQIAANLQSAAQTAQSGGNTSLATQLNQLAADFTSASQSGQLPNLQDLAQAIGGTGHGRHHSASAGSSGLSQLLATLEASGNPNSSVNAATIIENTLTSAGITS